MAINSVGPAYYGSQPSPYYPGMPTQGGAPVGYPQDVYAPGGAYGAAPVAPMPVTGQVMGQVGGIFQGIIGGIINGITGFFKAILGAVTGIFKGIIEIFTGKHGTSGNPAAPYPGIPFNPAAPPMGGMPIPPGPTNPSDPRVVKNIGGVIQQITAPQIAVQLIRNHMQRAQQQHDAMVAESKDLAKMAADLKSAAQRRDSQRAQVLQQQIVGRLEDMRERSIAVYDESLYATIVNNAVLSPAGRFGAARINLNSDLETMWKNWSGGSKWWIFGHTDGAQELYTRTNQVVNDAMAAAAGLVPQPYAGQPNAAQPYQMAGGPR